MWNVCKIDHRSALAVCTPTCNWVQWMDTNTSDTVVKYTFSSSIKSVVHRKSFAVLLLLLLFYMYACAQIWSVGCGAFQNTPIGYVFLIVWLERFGNHLTQVISMTGVLRLIIVVLSCSCLANNSDKQFRHIRSLDSFAVWWSWAEVSLWAV